MTKMQIARIVKLNQKRMFQRMRYQQIMAQQIPQRMKEAFEAGYAQSAQTKH